MDILRLFAILSATGGTVLGMIAFARAREAYRTETMDQFGREKESHAFWRRMLAPVAVHFRPTNKAELELLKTQLMSAGKRSQNAVDRFCEERIVAMLVGLVFCWVWMAAVGGGFGLIVGMLSLLAGLIGPQKILALQAAERRDKIDRELPGAVDLLTTCIEAGLSLEKAIQRVARELAHTSPSLSHEFQITANEFQAGIALPDTLRRMARRVGLDELSALCGVVAQAHGLGAPIGTTMREYAESSRRKRLSQLEERAGKLAAQLTIPLALCLMPSAMVIILGPAILQLVRALQ